MSSPHEIIEFYQSKLNFSDRQKLEAIDLYSQYSNGQDFPLVLLIFTIL